VGDADGPKLVGAADPKPDDGPKPAAGLAGAEPDDGAGPKAAGSARPASGPGPRRNAGDAEPVARSPAADRSPGLDRSPGAVSAVDGEKTGTAGTTNGEPLPDCGYGGGP
jgi:hypothetical protein